LAKIKEAQKIILIDEAVVAPVYHYVQSYAVAPKVKELKSNPLGVVRYDELRVQR
jgi:ABC-type oligopeptide transport system substrate-binding subunit